MSIKLQRIIISSLLLFCFSAIEGQNIRNYAVEVSCSVRIHNSTQSILDFNWRYLLPTPIGQRVFRKTKTAYSWGAALRTIPTTDSTFSDTVSTGVGYEYRFEKDTGHDGYSVQGYIYAGHRLPANKNRGTILLIIDSTHKTFLNNNLRTYRNDLIGDGWFTKILWVSPATTVATIKTYIVAQYNAAPTQVKTVCLIGDVAVPYSGDFRASGNFPPDGHTTGSPPSHEGAWPADQYYGDINSSAWSDISVTNNLGARAANNNNSSDGKFDQTFIPTLLELEVGRIDLSDLPAFSETERELLQRYFTKNHDYKHKVFTPIERCLIDDNFGLLNYPYPFIDEHFATNAYRNMAPLKNRTVCSNIDYLSNLNTNSYQWSFGFGAGNYNSASGIGTTGNFASSTQEVRSVFTGLFGSYFGDFDNSNNLLRGVLGAKGHTLNSFWCGRPHWFFHHMGLGDHIGYSTLRTQNNFNTATSGFLYPTPSFGYRQIHAALMGDPSTRFQVVEPVSKFTVRQDSCHNRFILKWNAPADTAVHRFYLFRAKHIDSVFTHFATTTNNTYKDSFPLTGNNVYMARPLKLQESGSGTYFNLGQGLFDTIAFFLPIANAGPNVSVCRNSMATIGVATPSNTVNCTYLWQTGDSIGSPLQIRVTSNITKYLFVTDTLSGCLKSDTISLTTFALPIKETVSNDANPCSDSIQWTATTNNGAGHNYRWQFEGGIPNDINGNMLSNPDSVAYPLTGNFSTILTLTNGNNCMIKDTFNHTVSCISLSIYPLIFTCQNNALELDFLDDLSAQFHSLRFEGYADGKWKTISIIKLSAKKQYSIEKPNLYTEFRVLGLSDAKETLLSNCNATQAPQKIIVSPNPFNQEITISTQVLGLINKPISYEIFDSKGQRIAQSLNTLFQKQIHINTESFSSGLYLLKITLNQETINFKIVK